MRALGGTIAVPSDPGLDLLAGLPAVAHQGATDDVLRASDPAVIAGFRRSAARAVATRRFSAIVTENAGPPDGFPPDLGRYYRRCPQTLLPGVPQSGVPAGRRVRPDGRLTCGCRPPRRARRRSARSMARRPRP